MAGGAPVGSAFDPLSGSFQLIAPYASTNASAANLSYHMPGGAGTAGAPAAGAAGAPAAGAAGAPAAGAGAAAGGVAGGGGAGVVCAVAWAACVSVATNSSAAVMNVLISCPPMDRGRR